MNECNAHYIRSLSFGNNNVFGWLTIGDWLTIDNWLIGCCCWCFWFECQYFIVNQFCCKIKTNNGKELALNFYGNSMNKNRYFSIP